MELLNKDLKEKLKNYPIYSQDGKGGAAVVIAKLFNPYGLGSWYILEGEPIDNGKDYRLFGYIESHINPSFNEYGYFLLSELETAKIPIDLEDEKGNIKTIGYGQIERDLFLKENTKLNELITIQEANI